MSTAPWPEPELPAERRPARWGGALASVGIGLGAAILGLLPWIVTGMRLPLQNLWVLPGGMPVAWLPFSQYTVAYVLGLLVVGAAAAGIAARALRDRLPRAAPFSIAAGLLFVQLVATAQATEVLRMGIRTGRDGSVYLAACVAVAAFGIAVGVLLFGLIARGARPAAVVALALAAVATGWWMAGAPFLLSPLPPLLVPLATWAPAVLVGVAIAWGGIRAAGRIVAAAMSLGVLWVVPALAGGVQAAVGSRALLRSPAELLEHGWRVFLAELTTPELVLPRIGVAVLVAALGVGVGTGVSRRGAPRP
ncbi:MAG: hypothetical protein DI534_10065 [Leifsonia xyli]|nr:MAG: hypothetical protein DI534_10065 [Leifsonia xyli]